MFSSFFFLIFGKGPAKKRDDKGSVRSPAAEIVFQRHLRSEEVCLRSFRTSPSESKVEEVPTQVLTENRRNIHFLGGDKGSTDDCTRLERLVTRPPPPPQSVLNEQRLPKSTTVEMVVLG